MKNIHILSTDKQSKLFKLAGDLYLHEEFGIDPKRAQNIYITSDEEIKEGDWMIRDNEQPTKVTPNFFWDFGVRYYKIILTTDQDLIKDGVQAIDDDFLEWFVKNPSCEFINIEKCICENISKEETLEERKPYWNLVDIKAEQNNTIDLNAYANGVEDGVKWQQERMYSEEEIRQMFNRYNEVIAHRDIEEWQAWIDKQFKKK